MMDTATSTLPGPRRRVFIGFSVNEMRACVIAEASLRMTARRVPDIRRISRQSLWRTYARPTSLRDGQLWDDLSNAPMSTDHALARFWIPFLCDYSGWALFTDGDVLFRRDIEDIFRFADERYAVMCVQHSSAHDHATGLKKDGIVQLPYPKKNWSSVMLFNCGHFANHALTPTYLNQQTGRRLHGFAWLADAEIGPLPKEWNYLVGEPSQAAIDDPAIVHYTLGTPDLPGHAYDPFAAEWRAVGRVASYTMPEPGEQGG